MKALQRMRNILGKRYCKIITENSVNILSIIYATVYFPTYSNSLKDIGKYLGYRWQDEKASGIQSLIWRHHFEKNKEEALKKKLIAYNLDDCFALKKVTESLQNLSSNDSSNIVSVENIKEKSIYKWGKVNFQLNNLEFINQRAYFDYQRDKIFLRTNKNLRNLKQPKRNQKNRKYKVNKSLFYCKMSLK